MILPQFGNSIHGSLPWQILYLPVMRLKKLQIRSKYWCFLALITIFGRIYHKICHIMLRSSNGAALLRRPVMQGRRQSWLHKKYRLALLWLVYHKFLKEYHPHWLIKNRSTQVANITDSILFEIYLIFHHGTTTAVEREQFTSVTMVVTWYYLQMIWQIVT